MTAFEYIEQECKKLGDEADAARARLFELLDSEHTRAEFEEAKEKIYCGLLETSCSSYVKR